MRHLVVIDLRSEAEFSESHIRKSVASDLESLMHHLTSTMLAKKDNQFRSQYINDDLTRVLFIFP